MEKSTCVQLIHPHTLSSCVPRSQVTDAGLSAHMTVCLLISLPSESFSNAP